MFGSVKGAVNYMTRLKQCSTEVIGLIKKMFTCLIKDAFRYRFKFQCPKYLCRVRDLSFLPHLLQRQMSWHEVTLTQLTLALEIPPNDLDLALMQPGRLQPEEGTHPVGSRLLSYRLDNNGALPTRMKFFYSWNLSSWTSTAAQDYRLRRCRRLLKRGPICLQETKWKGPETEALYQGLPGVKIAHTPAVAFANGHDIVKIRINVRPNVLNNPHHPKHEVIPSGVFMPGKDGTPISSTSELQSLVRLLHREHGRLFTEWHCEDVLNRTLSPPPPVTGRCSPLDNVFDCSSVCLTLPPPVTGRCSPQDSVGERAFTCPGYSCSAYLGSHLSIAGCFWAWWRSQPPPQLHPNIRPYCRARKYLSSGAQWVNVPKDVVEDLVVASKHSVLSSTETLQTVNGCFSMPRTLVQSMVEVIDACVEGIPYVPLDEANMQARGLGSMVAFWERMRHICPKVNIYHGPIVGKDGGQCVTSQDLDEAMLATRDFWFQSPVEHDETWQPILDRYAEGEPWVPFSPPDEEVFLNTLLHTKDSAPGPDGLPYSAWRLLPKVTVEAMKSYFYDIINGTFPGQFRRRPKRRSHHTHHEPHSIHDCLLDEGWIFECKRWFGS